MKWLNYIPLLRLIIPFSLGIIWAFYNPTPITLPLIILLGFLTVSNFIIIKLKYLHSRFYNRWIFGLFSFTFIFLIGNFHSNYRIEKFKPNHFSKLISNNNSTYSFIGIVNSEPEIKANSIKAVLSIKQVKTNNQWHETIGNCLVYFKKSDSIKLEYGSKITFIKKPENIKPPGNFDEFNYKQYLSHHYIYQRLYLANKDYQIIGFQPQHWLKRKAIEWRNTLLNRYQKFGIEGEELAILSALTLGKKESLTPELKSAYSSAGAMHVLAVSGLHVGIIFIVLKFLLSWLDRFKIGVIIKALLLIICIWLYAFLTGLSPSVIRAATMFTFMVFALSFKRTSNIYNTLALSAFAILIYQPFMLLEVGFQLSYLAVIGIIYLHPYLYNLITVKPWLANQAWNITCVSLSAQLVTAPLGILYFHQFPTYFLFSNLIVIPAAFTLMGVSIAFQALSFIPILGTGIGYLLKGLVLTLNTSVKYLEKLPSSLLGGLDISIFETWLFYFIILGVTIWLTQYKRKFVLLTLIVVFALVISQTFEKWNQLHQKQITFYQTGKDFSLEFITGNSVQFTADSSLILNPDKMQFYIYHHWWKRGITTNTPVLFTIPQKSILLGNTRILRIDNNEICSCEQVNKLKPDIIYFNTYRNIQFDSISRIAYQPLVIIGPRTSNKIRKELTQFCESRNWTCHDLRESGALKIYLDEQFKPNNILAANP